MPLQSKPLVGFALVMKKIKDLAAKQNGREYKVIRGGVNWARFPFEKFPRAIGIVVDERSFNRAINYAELTFEMMVQMPDDPTKLEDGIDDQVMNSLTDDMLMIIEEVGALTNENNQPLIHRVHQGFDKLLEVSDADRMVQGVLATIKIDF